MSRDSIAPADLRLAVALLCLALVCLHAGRADAQGTPVARPAASATAPPVVAPAERLPRSPIELVSRAGDAEAELGRIEEDTRFPPRLLEIENELTTVRDPLRKQAKRWLGLVQDAHNDGQMIDIIYLWSRKRRELMPMMDELSALSVKYEKHQRRLDDLLRVWSNAEADSNDSLKTPAAVHERISGVVGAINSTRLQVGNRQGRLLRSIADLVDLTRNVDDVIAAARLARPSLLNAGETRRTFPLWQLPPAGPTSWSTRLAESHGRNVSLIKDFVQDSKSALAIHLLTLLLAGAAVARLGKRPRSDAVEQIVSHRYAAAGLLALLATPLLYDSAPTAVQVLLGIITVVVALPLISPMVQPALRPASYLSVALFGLASLRYLMLGVALLSRLWQCAIFVVALVAFGLVSRRLRRTAPAAGLPRWISSATGMGVVATLLGTALLTNVLGYVELSTIVGNAMLRGAHFAVMLYLGFRVINALTQSMLEGEPFMRLAVVRNHRPILLKQIRATLVLGTAVWWLWLLLELLTIEQAVRTGLHGALNENLTIGSLHVTLGSIALLGVGIYVAVKASRVVKFLLNEDVLPRTPLARGAQYALSATASYLTMVVIFVGTLAAVGFELSQFAFIVGALGVGIGFGLQNVVNNFVSGLVLLFGRPLEVGHTIEAGGKLGEVTRIGFRSSTMRTLSGAEIIMPNADLISGQVINWTLSDSLRRIEIPVGVAYGSEVERVLRVLKEVTVTHPNVLAEPPADVLFVGFGDSSLNFDVRSWVDFQHYVQTRSDLVLAINNALVSAKIEIPFPQRDLHLRSVDTRVAAAWTSPAGEPLEEPVADAEEH